MKQTLKPFTIFLRFLKIGITGFGGGSALIPVIEKELVGEGKPMSEEDYIKHTVIANITPGALPVKIGATAGYQLGGSMGAIAGAYGAMLPGTLLTLFIMALFSAMGAQAITMFHYASVGITVFIVMLLVNYTLKICNQGQRAVNWLLCGSAFLLTCGKEIRQLIAQVFSLDYASLPTPIFDISTIHLMIISFVLIMFSITKPRHVEAIAAGILAVGYCFFNGKAAGALPARGMISYIFLAALLALLIVKLLQNRSKGKPSGKRFGMTRTVAVTIALFLAIPLVLALAAGFFCRGIPASLLGNVALSTVTSFGGGEAYVSVADGFFVQSGVIRAETFYTQLVSVANALPGPILIKIAGGIGFLFGQAEFGFAAAWTVGLAAATLAIGVCCVVALLVMQIYEAVEKSAFIINLRRYILPVICGMLLSTSCAMLHTGVEITSKRGIAAGIALAVMIAWVTLLRWLHHKFRLHDLVLLFSCAALSLLVLVML